MALESATYISELVDTNPVASDPVGQGDDHLKMIKTVLKTQFSGLAGTTAITTSEAELNYVDGVTSAIQTQLAARLLLAGGTMSGTIAADDEQITKPRLTDYSETVAAAGSQTTAFNIDLESGNVQTLTMSGGGTFNIGIINALGSHSNSLTILGTNLGSVTATFYAGAHDGGGNKVYWVDGDDTTNNLLTSSGTDVVTFTSFDGGTKFYGFIAGKDMTNS